MYLVTAKKWDYEEQRQVTFVVGVFDKYADALTCKKEYSMKYSTQAKILDGNDL